MEKELANVLFWLGNIIDLHDIRLGEYEAMFDEAAQFSEWHCLGCSGIGFSKWPKWEVTLTHAPDCTFQKLNRLIEEATAQVESQAVADSKHTDAG